MYVYLSLISALGWGISPILDKLILRNLDYLSFTPIKLFSYVLYGLIIAILFRKKIKTNIDNKKINYKVVLTILVSATVSFLAGLSYYKAISLNTGYLLNIAVISHIIPIIVIAILSSILFKREINYKMILGMMLTFSGVYLTIKNTPK
jgi:uncharacterized membrane protein